MKHIGIEKTGELALVRLKRGAVNAINHEMVLELLQLFHGLRDDDSVGGVVLTGSGKFFTFGFDIPEFMSWSKDAFIEYLTDFTRFYREVFLFPKPVVAALNGHTIAGGCMIALACDRRLMAEGTSKISLNEVDIGASVFAGATEMLKARVGHAVAEQVLYSGDMYMPEEALSLGLIDRVCPADELLDIAMEEAAGMAARDPVAFAGIKNLLRRPVLDDFSGREAASVQEFADIWYSEETRKKLAKITIGD